MSDDPHDLAELRELIDQLESTASNWRYDGGEIEELSTRVKNLIRRVYDEPRDGEALREFMQAARSRRIITNRTNRQAIYVENLPRLTGHLRGLLKDVTRRVGDPTALLGSLEISPVVKMFIAHDGDSEVRRKLQDFISALGIEPIVVELQPRITQTPSSNIDAHLELCGYGFAIARKCRAEKRKGELIARANVVDEIERFRSVLGDKWSVALEEGVTLPSNLSEFLHSGFRGQCLDDVFMDLMNDLRAHGMIRVGSSE